jgi:DNA polymerase-3 subunit gamma/tau
MQQDLELIKSIVNYKELTLVSAQWQLDDLQRAFEQLSTSQRQLQSNLNAATWLEVCLLQLIPTSKALKVPKTKPTHNTGNTHGDRTYRTGTHSTEKELQQVWDTVINNSTKPGNKEFLKIAQLVKLSDRQATLAVQRKYLKKFQAKQNAIASLMKKALKLRATPTLIITSL